MDILQIVPLSILKGNNDFFEYLFESNNSLGLRQVVNLSKIAAFCKDTSLREDRQSELRKQSLDFWKVPDKARFCLFLSRIQFVSILSTYSNWSVDFYFMDLWIVFFFHWKMIRSRMFLHYINLRFYTVSERRHRKQIPWIKPERLSEMI